MESKKCSGECGEIKPLDPGFYPDKRKKDGYKDVCKKCYNIRRSEDNARKTRKRRKSRVFTRNELDIFQLGILEGEDRCRDQQKVISAQKVTIDALVEAMNDADARDKKGLNIPK